MLRTYRAKLVASHFGLVLAVVAVILLLLDWSLQRELGRRLDERLEEQAKGAAQWWGAGEGRRHPERIAARFASVLHADVSLYDRDGALLADSRATEGGSAEARPDRGALPPDVKDALAHGKGRSAGQERGETVHYVAVRAQDGALVRIGAPMSDIDAAVRATRMQLLLVAVVGGVFALGCAFVVSRNAAKPLKTMTAAASRISKGDFDVRIEHPSPDEFGVLATALTDLAAELRTRLEELSGERAEVQKLLRVQRDFVANASHELRTPVMAIQGSAETLLSGSADVVATKHFTETIHRHALRLGKLVDDLLELSSFDLDGKARLRKVPIAIGPLAALVAETHFHANEARGGETIRVDVQVERELAALGDPDALERILDNLVENAVKYGRGTVVITARSDADRVHLLIHDDGGGIDAEHLPRLFERFYRVDKGRARDQGGTGLGLAIVEELATAMGGGVTVSSIEGEGTTFTVTLIRA